MNDADARPITVEVTARCLKCAGPRLMADPRRVTMKNGRPAVTGFCSECGTKQYRIGAVE